MANWKAWDAQGKCYSSKDTCACALPDSLQFVISYTDSGREVHTGATSDLDRWYGFTPEGILDAEGERPTEPPDAVWKLGVWTTDELYEQIAAEAYSSKWQS